jgi:hypothetical protein
VLRDFLTLRFAARASYQATIPGGVFPALDFTMLPKAPCDGALHFAHYNLVRLHKTLRVTPAMAANVTDRVWSLEELVERTSKDGAERCGGGER